MTFTRDVLILVNVFNAAHAFCAKGKYLKGSHV